MPAAAAEAARCGLPVQGGNSSLVVQEPGGQLSKPAAPGSPGGDNSSIVRNAAEGLWVVRQFIVAG
jgi:hypothetical protein